MDMGDPDMVDAALLLSPDANGDPWWRPSSLADLDAAPERVLQYLQQMRAGLGARSRPWVWWRPQGKRERAHLYRRTYAGVPDDAAACGAVPREGVERWEDTGGKFACPACQKAEGGNDPKGSIRAVNTVNGQPMRG